MTEQATKTIIRPAASKLAAALNERTNTDQLFNAVMNRFAKRERARIQVTLGNLRVTMIKEGYANYSIEKYQDVLKFLASLGLGTLKTDSKGNVIALVDIRHTLQSIGRVAAGIKDAKLESFKKANVYKPLDESQLPAHKPAAVKPTDYPATLQVTIDGKVVYFPLPRAISPAELGFLLADLYSRDMKFLTGGTSQ